MPVPAPMRTWVALLRGINVGGRNILPMADLRACLTTLGYSDVKTYIQSGNCVFRTDADRGDPSEGAAAISRDIAAAIETAAGFRPRVFVLTADALHAAIAANPYPRQGLDDPKSVHFYFLSDPSATVDMDALAPLRAGFEDVTRTGGVVYLHAPDGIGRSKLAEHIDRRIGTPVTARNLRTAMKLTDMARSLTEA